MSLYAQVTGYDEWDVAGTGTEVRRWCMSTQRAVDICIWSPRPYVVDIHTSHAR